MSELAEIFKRYEHKPIALLVQMALAAGFSQDEVQAALKEYMENNDANIERDHRSTVS